MVFSRKWYWLIGLVYLIATWFSAGFNQSDEHFQILEFAGLHLGKNEASDLAWEYEARMRPGLQPAMAYGLHRALGLLGGGEVNPFVVAWLLRLISAVFSLLVAALLYTVFRERYEERAVAWWFFLFSFLLWVGVYNGIRFNSENWSGNCFALAVGLYTYWRNQPNHLQYLLLGALVGLAFVFRYQLAIMIAGWGLWLILIARERWDKLLVFTLGGLLAAGLGVVFDYWLYGEWLCSGWHYFEQNILLDKASNFGVDPWWHYLTQLVIKGIPPFSLFYVAAIVAFFWLHPRHWLTWVALPFILVHSLIAHKELRFLYPLLPFLPIALADLVQIIRNWDGAAWWKRTVIQRWSKRLFWGHNALLALFVAFWPIIPEMDIYRLLYKQYTEPITLYGVEDNPYRLALDARYYRRESLQVRQINDFQQLPQDTTLLIAFDQKHAPKWLAQLPADKQLVYKSYPDWLQYFNVNDWLSRTQQWYIYEVRLE